MIKILKLRSSDANQRNTTPIANLPATRSSAHYVFSLGVPFWVIIVTAGKSAVDARQPNLALPNDWELGKNISSTFSEGNMGVASLGSLLLLIPSVFGVLLLGAMASWVLARRKTRGLSIAYTIGISGVIVPPAIVPIVLLLKQIGLQGTLPD